MRYNPLGRTGLYVSELCLGTMTFGGGEGFWRVMGQVGVDEATELVKAALDAGVNIIDTANVYSEGRSEEILGEALKRLGVRRSQVVIATKVLGPMGSGPNEVGVSRGHVLDQIDASLNRLQLDHVDLYQIHGFDPGVPMEESLRAMDEVVRSGRARYVGLSNWAAWQVAKAVGMTQRLDLAPIASLQAYYTLAGRELEREVVPMLQSEGVGLMVWSPLAGGYLSGKDVEGDAGSGSRRSALQFPPVDDARGRAVVAELRRIGEAHGATPARVALAWLLHQPAVSTVIVGAKRPDQLADNLGAAELELSQDDLRRLDEVSRLTPEYPGWMLSRQGDYRKLPPARERYTATSAAPTAPAPQS